MVRAAPGLRGHAQARGGPGTSSVRGERARVPAASLQGPLDPAFAEGGDGRLRPVLPKPQPPSIYDDATEAGDLWPGERGYVSKSRSRVEWPDGKARLAMLWLKAHQAPDGSWVPGAHGKWCKGKLSDESRYADDYVGDARFTVATTGMALSAFLTFGYTNRGKHLYKVTVSKGLRWLKNQQSPQGAYGEADAPYALLNHVWATLAMVQAYGLTESPIFKYTARMGLEHLLASRRDDGTWGMGRRTDMVLTGLACLAIRSGEVIALDQKRRGKRAWWSPPQDVYGGPATLAQTFTDGRLGETGLTMRGDGMRATDVLPTHRRHDASRLTTCLAVLVRGYAGATPADDPEFAGMLRYLRRHLPSAPMDAAGGPADLMYLGLAPLVVPVDRSLSAAWGEALKSRFVEAQVEADAYCGGLGSFDPMGAWGPAVGRSGTTALALMALAHPIYSHEAGRMLSHQTPPRVVGVRVR